MKRRGRPTYSDEYRREALRLVESGTKTLTQIARELGIDQETLRLWRRQAEAADAPTDAPTDAPRAVPSLEEENRRLRRENARLLEEREILKKAMAFFAKDAR